MHQWEDTGIVISVSRYGEQSAVVRFLTDKHGLFPCMVKGAFAKSARGIYQAGNVMHIAWQARLEEQLGHAKCELLRSCTGQLLQDGTALQVMNAVSSMVLTCVPERILEKDIYLKIIDIIRLINSLDESKVGLFRAYAELEFTLLYALGFGLDLSECAATGVQEDLIYVSPKSGRAVCREAGEPYKNRMLPLPDFFKDANSAADMPQILDALALTGYFLEGWVLQPEGKKLPDARHRLVQQISS